MARHKIWVSVTSLWLILKTVNYLLSVYGLITVTSLLSEALFSVFRWWTAGLLTRSKCCCVYQDSIQLFQLTLSDYSFKPTRQDRMVVWVIHWNLHICVDENYKSFYSCVWSLSVPHSECVCSQESFSVAFEEKEKKPAKSSHLISIQHVQQPTYTHTTIWSCRIGLKLWSNNVTRNSCKPDFVSGLQNCLEFSQPLSCLYQAMQTRKTFSIA